MTGATMTLLGSALLMGLFGGAHCVVMCGAASSSLCAKRGRFMAAYNAGRVFGYTSLGVVAGLLGGAPLGIWGGSTSVIDVIRFALRVVAAICLLTVGLHLVGLPSFVKSLESVGAPIWRRVLPIAQRLLPLRSSWQALAAGALWALMPCGLLYGAIALAASSESALVGGATMFAFALGTLPLMFALGAFAVRVARAMSRGWVRRAAGVVFLGFGLWSASSLAQHVELAGAPTGSHCAAHD